MKMSFQKLCIGKSDLYDLLVDSYLNEWNELGKFLSATEVIIASGFHCFYDFNDPIVTKKIFMDSAMGQ